MAITNEYIAKIEGHGSLNIDWSKETVQLNVHEGERLFEGILVGRTAEESHWITPRICGVCPIAHNLASIRAVEDAYGIKVNYTTKLLRRLMVAGQMLQSHALHLFFLVLPDYLGIDRGTELAKSDPKSFAKALSIKELGDEIAIKIAGRNVHPTRTTVGGFHKLPTKEELEGLLELLEKTKENAEWAVKLLMGIKMPKLSVALELVSLDEENIISNEGEVTPVKDYKKNIEEELRDYSTAKFGKFQGKEMMIGSLARLINAKNKYSKNKLISKSIAALDPKNPFHNNLAQAIEILVYHLDAVEVVNELLKIEMDGEIAKPSKNPSLKGIGTIEAPRGGLYHELHLDKDGNITYANIITPTVQNLTSMEKSANALLNQTQDLPQKEREHLLDMVIRAYDPCITCSVH
jgi:coenzyme F420-reducing hydrogenase alpha subunit